MQCAFYIAGKQTTGEPHIQHENTPENCNRKPINDSRINKRKKHAPRKQRGRQETRDLYRKNISVVK
jgi:hypothetical protein